MTVEQSSALAAVGANTPPRVRVGVLALQGSFREHMALLSKVDGVEVVEVRTKEELQGLSGLVIPGGESTTMAHIAERWGLIPELQAFAKQGRPIWGTCAGMIFLAERAEGEQAAVCCRRLARLRHVGGGKTACARCIHASMQDSVTPRLLCSRKDGK